jgi:DNA-binding transcriptional ArsR family regulator
MTCGQAPWPVASASRDRGHVDADDRSFPLGRSSRRVLGPVARSSTRVARDAASRRGSCQTRRAGQYGARATVNPVVNDSFKALSHPIRRGIVERLAAGPATVGVATAGFGVSKPAISKHLKVLEETGVVKRVVEGRTHQLSLQPDVLTEAADWMDRQRALWSRMFDVVDEYLKEERSK